MPVRGILESSHNPHFDPSLHLPPRLPLDLFPPTTPDGLPTRYIPLHRFSSAMNADARRHNPMSVANLVHGPLSRNHLNPMPGPRSMSGRRLVHNPLAVPASNSFSVDNLNPAGGLQNMNPARPQASSVAEEQKQDAVKKEDAKKEPKVHSCSTSRTNATATSAPKKREEEAKVLPSQKPTNGSEGEMLAKAALDVKARFEAAFEASVEDEMLAEASRDAEAAFEARYPAAGAVVGDRNAVHATSRAKTEAIETKYKNLVTNILSGHQATVEKINSGNNKTILDIMVDHNKRDATNLKNLFYLLALLWVVVCFAFIGGLVLGSTFSPVLTATEDSSVAVWVVFISGFVIGMAALATTDESRLTRK